LSPTSPDQRVVVVGDVYLDYSLDVRIMRLGGIFHAARALQALRVPYSVAYTGPEYLEADIQHFAGELGSDGAHRVGIVTGAPALILAGDAREAGHQGYDEILRGSKKISWDNSSLERLLANFRPSDVLVVPGAFPLPEVLRAVAASGARIHIDIQYDVDPSVLNLGGVPLETIFVSTSTALFQTGAGGNPEQLRRTIGPALARNLVLKENRGGSRVFLEDGRIAEAPSFPSRTQHSIGVGDCFDCAWIAMNQTREAPSALALASYIASLYASTWSHEEFLESMTALLAAADDVTAMCGTRIRWEDRKAYTIYIAAPDFPDVDTAPLDALAESLEYHNFTPRRPVKEHGLYTTDLTDEKAKKMYHDDLNLLESSNLLIAVPLTNDPGTFTELGVASALGIPTILWNPRDLPQNLFAWYCAGQRCSQLHEVIDTAFVALANPSPAGWVDR